MDLGLGTRAPPKYQDAGVSVKDRTILHRLHGVSVRDRTILDRPFHVTDFQ